MASIFDLFDKIKKQDHFAQSAIEFLIVGLGNPGLKYEKTRHNAGFMAIDYLARKINTDLKKMRFKSLTGECTIEGKRCLMMKPNTFMNNSGEAVVEAMNFYKIPIENVIVLYDDISLDPPKLRIRRKGSHGGHNGIRSIIDLTGADTFPRIKIGVGKKPNAWCDLADWVLSSFTEDELKDIDLAAEHASDAVGLMVNGKTDEAMNRYNA